MFRTPKRASVLFALLLVTVMSTTALADTIRLKDGSILKGRIVSFAGGRFTIAIGEGSRARQMTFGAAEIDSITFDAPAETTAAVNRDVDYKRPVASPRVVVSDEIRRPAAEPEMKRPELKKPEPRIPQPTVATRPTIDAPVRSASPATPISWSVKVSADNTSNGWTNTGWVVKKGQVVRISGGDGTITIAPGKTTGASGSPDIADANKLLRNVPTGALIAVIGDDNNEFIYIGASREITATRDGALFLGINEGNLDDNAGAFNVKIEILPGTAN